MLNYEKVNILLVDDDEVDCSAVLRAFQKQKMANPITVAGDGIQALELLRGTHGKARLASPFIILLDLRLPKMNGIEFLVELRKDPDLKKSVVFVLSTSCEDHDILSAYELNIAGYMMKSDLGDGFLKLTQMLQAYWQVVRLP